MVYTSASIKYYIFYIVLRRGWVLKKMPSFPNDFAYAKCLTCLAVAAWRAPGLPDEGITATLIKLAQKISSLKLYNRKV